MQNNVKSDSIALHPGDILMDSTTLEGAIGVIHSGLKLTEDEDRLQCLIQLTHALILHNRILIEPNSYDAHMVGWLLQLLKEFQLEELIKPITIERKTYDQIQTLADKRSKEASVTFPKISKGLVRHAFRVRQRMIGLYQNSSSQTIQDISPAIKAVLYRTYLNFGISCQLGLPYLPNIYRVPFIEHELRTKFTYQKVATSAIETVEKTVININRRRNLSLKKTLFKLDFPVIFTYVINKVKSEWKEIVPCVLEIRESKHAQAFRQLCSNLDQATAEGNISELGKLLDELEARSQVWQGFDNSPSLEMAIAFPPAIGFNPLDLWKVIKSQRQYHLIFLDKVFDVSRRSPRSWKKIKRLTIRDNAS